MDIKVVVLLVGTLCCVGTYASISPNEVRNDATDEIYHNVLIEPIINNFRTFVNGERNRNYGYIPNDVFLAQSIQTLQYAMFNLGDFYSLYKTHNGLPITYYEKGFVIQFESIKCDNVYSSKYPRKKPTATPWKFFTDSAYFKLNCQLPVPRRPPIRTRRGINTNNSPHCGNVFRFTENFGNLTFPVDGADRYAANIECQWTIEVASTFGVKINVTDILLEKNDPGCFYDAVKFYEGDDDRGRLQGTVCGNNTGYTVRSNMNVMTIKFKADDTGHGNGFTLKWSIVDEIKAHPGYVMTSMIVIDQHGDLNVDTVDMSTIPAGERFVPSVNADFKLMVQEPQTCPAKSGDPECEFQQKPFLVSKIISTGISPDFTLPKDAITVVFEHAIQKDLYPALYDAPKYCVTWDGTVLHTKFGSWSRRNGKTLYTNRAKTTCVFSKTGVHAVIAMAPPPIDPEPFRFTRSWYCGHLFAVLWITFTFIKLSSKSINIPVWLNINQLLAVLLFCGICLCGVHVEWHHSACSFLTFALYFFGLSVFVWHLLKAAQFTGAFDKFFRQDRNLYAFYLLFGWGSPFFVVGIAGGVQLIFAEGKMSCWMAIKGGPIWGYGAPAYFIILCILVLYYKGLKRNIERLMKYNYTKLVRRTIRDSIQLILFIASWATGVLSFHQEDVFLHQYLFCIFLSLTIVSLCLFAQQARRSFEKIHDSEDLYEAGTDFYDHDDPFFKKEPDLVYKIWLAKTYYIKWKKMKEPEKLRIALKLLDFEGAMINYVTRERCSIDLRPVSKTIHYDDSAQLGYNNLQVDDGNDAYEEVEQGKQEQEEEEQTEQEEEEEEEDIDIPLLASEGSCEEESNKSASDSDKDSDDNSDDEDNSEKLNKKNKDGAEKHVRIKDQVSLDSRLDSAGMKDTLDYFDAPLEEIQLPNEVNATEVDKSSKEKNDDMAHWVGTYMMTNKFKNNMIKSTKEKRKVTHPGEVNDSEMDLKE